MPQKVFVSGFIKELRTRLQLIVIEILSVCRKLNFVYPVFVAELTSIIQDETLFLRILWRKPCQYLSSVWIEAIMPEVEVLRIFVCVLDVENE